MIFAFTAACLPPHCCLISSPLPTTCSRNGLDRFFFFFLVLISLLGSFVKLCYKQRDKRNEESGVSELQRGQRAEQRDERNEESSVGTSSDASKGKVRFSVKCEG